MTKKEYDKVMSCATFGERVKILFWKPKRRLFFLDGVQKGKSFMSSFICANNVSYDSLNEWYNENIEAIKK